MVFRVSQLITQVCNCFPFLEVGVHGNWAFYRHHLCPGGMVSKPDNTKINQTIVGKLTT